MSEPAPDLTPEAARARLEQATTTKIGTGRDRWIHGASSILYGLVWGGYFGFLVRSDGPLELTDLLLIGAAILVALGAHVWRNRAGAVPRHAARAHDVGTWVSFGVILVLPFVPAPPVDEPWLSLIASGLIALPIVAAGIWIMVVRR